MELKNYTLIKRKKVQTIIAKTLKWVLFQKLQSSVCPFQVTNHVWLMLKAIREIKTVSWLQKMGTYPCSIAKQIVHNNRDTCLWKDDVNKKLDSFNWQHNRSCIIFPTEKKSVLSWEPNELQPLTLLIEMNCDYK